MSARHVQVVKVAAEKGEDGPCHQLVGVHPFAQKYPLLEQKSLVCSLILLRLLDEI